MADITPLSEEAFVTMAVCEETRKPYGITVDRDAHDSFKLVWSFKIDKEKAHREGYDVKRVRGGVKQVANFPGCPRCGTKDWYCCSNCNTIVCYHGQEYVTCPNCGSRGRITQVEKIDLKGGMC